jgi:hypothetical protein
MPCGDHIGAAFELADFLAAHEGDALGAARLRVAPDVVLDERAQAGDAGWSVTDRRLRQTAGLCRQGEVDGAVAAVVAACDGSRPLAAVLGEAARSAGADTGAVARAALPVTAGWSSPGSCSPPRREAQTFLFSLTSNPAEMGEPGVPSAPWGVKVISKRA